MSGHRVQPIFLFILLVAIIRDSSVVLSEIALLLVAVKERICWAVKVEVNITIATMINVIFFIRYNTGSRY